MFRPIRVDHTIVYKWLLKLIHSFFEKFVRAHTNLVMRESLDDVLHHLLPGDIVLIIDQTVDESEEEPKV
jgi:hypothetical protein